MMIRTKLLRNICNTRRVSPALVFVLVFTVLWLPTPAAEALEPGEGPALLAQRKSRSARRAQRRKARRNKRKRGRSADREADSEAREQSDKGQEAQAEGSEDEGAASEPAADTETRGEGGPQPSAGTLRRSNKMEFDARLIRGQTAGSGAVVLFDRGQRELPALTKMRTRFLDATVREVFDKDSAGASKR